MNTKIEYMYRDASNYKQFETVVVAGEVALAELMPNCHEEMGASDFIPSQVGLEDLQPRQINFPNEDDHVWHELLDASPTEMEPSIKLTADDIRSNFNAAKGQWNVAKAMEKLGIT